MRAAVVLAAFVIGEALALYGLYLAWLPLSLIVAGVQLVAAALLTEAGDSRAADGPNARANR